MQAIGWKLPSLGQSLQNSLLRAREKFHSAKLKTFLVSHSVLQHIFKEPCLA